MEGGVQDREMAPGSGTYTVGGGKYSPGREGAPPPHAYRHCLPDSLGTLGLHSAPIIHPLTTHALDFWRYASVPAREIALQDEDQEY